jgi:hypothetical protein
LRSFIARIVNELEELIRRSPNLVTPVARKARPSGKPKPVENPAGISDWIAINAIIPRDLPDRDDIQQDAFVCMRDGTTPDRKTAVKLALKDYRQSHNKWRDLSMDASIAGSDGLTLHDVIAAGAPEIEGEDDDWTIFNC